MCTVSSLGAKCNVFIGTCLQGTVMDLMVTQQSVWHTCASVAYQREATDKYVYSVCVCVCMCVYSVNGNVHGVCDSLISRACYRLMRPLQGIEATICKRM